MLFLVLVLATATSALVAVEPRYPTSICATLEAELKEGPLGYLPESAESKPDTKRIQAALHSCGAGSAVKLVKGTGNAFLSGPLIMKGSVTLWIDAGVTLFASRNPRDYDKDPHSCGVLGSHSTGCNPLITVKKSNSSAIVGEGIIDGRGGQKMTGANETWWELALRAKNTDKKQSCPRLIVVKKGIDFTLYKISLHNSPNFHFVTHDVKGLNVWGVKVDTPSRAYPAGTHARNTDAFDPNGKNIVISNCFINTGDDNIAIKGGESHVANVLVQNCHFYKGHGVSIGSETFAGVVNVTVSGCSFDGTDNGLRIKSGASYGGSVWGIRYQNICIRNVDAPLVFDTQYSTKKGSKVPNFHDIKVTNTHILSSNLKQVVFRGYNKTYPLKITLDNVSSDVKLFNVTASDAEITFGPGQVTNIPLATNAAKNVHCNGHPGKSATVDCSKMFVPFPR